jgi:hypothetical protein
MKVSEQSLLKVGVGYSPGVHLPTLLFRRYFMR